MAQCVVCTSLASVFCTQDKALLCSACDRSIHSANVLARRHHRLPVCELCKRNAATVYCHEDAAALCSVCEAEVHSANPLPHTCLHIDAALAQGLAKVTELPGLEGGAVSAPRSSSQQAFPATEIPQQLQAQQQPAAAAAAAVAPAAVGAPAAAAVASPAAQDGQPAEDEVSACGEHPAAQQHHHHHHHHAGAGGCMHGKRQTDAGMSVQHSLSEGNTSLAVVPDMGTQAGPSAYPTQTHGLPTQDMLNAKAPWAREFDALDFEAAWFGNLDGGFDLADLLGNDIAGLTDDAPGTVPSFPMGNQQQFSGAAPSSAAGAQLVPSAPAAVVVPELPGLGDSLPALGVEANKAVLPAPQQAQASDSEVLPPMLLDDDFVVPSFLPDDDEAMAAFGGVRASHQRHQPQQSFGMDDEEAYREGAQEHAAARAVEVAQEDLAAAAKLANRNKRSASVATEELHRESGRLPAAGPSSTNLAAAPSGAITTRRGSAVPPPPPLSALNGANLTREQRVARYREKRKNRKFHKTIRYASRKAYAEVRPRIKGRFATKEEVEAWKAKKAAGEVIAPEDELIF